MNREELIVELRWLAEARKEYETDVFPSIAREVQTARQLADILERKTPVTEGGHGSRGLMKPVCVMGGSPQLTTCSLRGCSTPRTCSHSRRRDE